MLLSFNIYVFKKTRKKKIHIYILFFYLFQKLSETTLQIPVSENPNKWSIVGIDSKAYLQNLVEARISGDFQIKQIELLANLKIKSLFTSNNLYCPHTLPKEFTFILPKNIKFTDKYQFISLGDKSWQESEDKENNLDD